MQFFFPVWPSSLLPICNAHSAVARRNRPQWQALGIIQMKFAKSIKISWRPNSTPHRDYRVRPTAIVLLVSSLISLLGLIACIVLIVSHKSKISSTIPVWAIYRIPFDLHRLISTYGIFYHFYPRLCVNFLFLSPTLLHPPHHPSHHSSHLSPPPSIFSPIVSA